MNQLQQVMLKDVPVIPVTEEVDWFQYDTSKFTGWVTQSNPYAQPAAYAYPDWGRCCCTWRPSNGCGSRMAPEPGGPPGPGCTQPRARRRGADPGPRGGER